MSIFKLESFIKWLIAATFVVPLTVVTTTYIFPFVVPKILLFRTITAFMLGGFILLLSLNWAKYKVRLTPLNGAVGLFWISLVVSTMVGVDWYKSFWDNHERMLGLFTLSHYIVYYFIVTSVIKEWRDWQWLLRLFLLSGMLVMIIGMLQKANPDLLLNRGNDRIRSTLGNAIYVGGYGLFLAFLGYLLYWQEKIRNHTVWAYIGLGGTLLGLIGIFLSGTRGALLGLLFGIAVLLLCYALLWKDSKKIRQSMVLIFVGGVVLMGVLFFFRQTSFVRSIPAVGRLLNTAVLNDSAGTRVMAWSIAIEAWREKPVFGWGPNNYYFAFNQFYRPSFLTHGWGETWFDNAHNAIVNTLAVQGLVGLIIYLGLFGTGIIVLWRAYKQGRIDVHVASIGIAFLAAHLVQTAFVFENPTSYLYFFFFLAFVNAQTTNVISQSEDKKKIGKQASIGLSILVAAVVLLFIYVTNGNVAKANKKTLQAIRTIQIDPRQAIVLYNEAAAYQSPHIDDIRNDFARQVFQELPQLAQQQGQYEVAKELFEFVYVELEKNLSFHPFDVRVHFQRAQLAELGSELTGKPELLVEAERLLEEALKISPRRQQFEFTLAPIKASLGKKEEAVALLKQSIDAEPRVDEAWWRLALLYEDIDQHDAAIQTIEEAKAKGIVFGSQGEAVVKSITGNVSTSTPVQ